MNLTKKEALKKIEELTNYIENFKEDVRWTEFTFLGKNFEISEDLGKMEWDEAVKRCKKLGGELPPRWLLVAIADEKELAFVKTLFSPGYHWSATEYSEESARYVYFPDGFASSCAKTDYHSVRCVREL